MKTLFTSIALLLITTASVFAAEPAEDWSRIYLGSNPSVDGTGQRFVFEWCDQIWLADVAGGRARRLGSGRSVDTWPVMHPDGTKVAFASDREGGKKVFVCDLTRDAVRQITFHSEATIPRAWGADANALLCLGPRDVSGPKRADRILLVRTDARKAEKILFNLPATDPAMSPDGKSILFTRRGDEPYRKRPHSLTPRAGEIWRYTPETETFEPLVVRKTDCRHPIWKPDGRGFYYLDATGGVRNVWSHDLASRTSRQLTFFTDDHVFQPSLSADGKTLVFRQKFDFWRFDPTTPEQAPERILLTPEPGSDGRMETRRRRYDACWDNDSPGDVSFCDNGTQVAFTTGGDLFVMDTIVRTPTRVHGETRTHERACAFSPDGKALYYLSDHGDRTTVMKAEPADAGKPWWKNTAFRRTVVLDDGTRRQNLSVSPDGARLAWSDPSGILTFADTNGTMISRGPAATKGGAYAWSPDGRHVAAQLADAYANYDVWLVSVDGKTPPCNLSRSFKYDGEPAWSPDGQIIAFVSERPELGTEKRLRYVYLDRELEETEAHDKDRPAPKGDAPAKPFDDAWLADLADRVRTVDCRAAAPFFSWDSRTIAFDNGSGRTDTVRVPTRLKPEKLFGCTGRHRAWIKKDDQVLWVVDKLPAIGERRLKFDAHQQTNLRDYRELGFRTAWARIRDVYYDPGTHGVDWKTVLDRYLEPARHAPSPSVFTRVMNMMLGELDSSHLGFSQTKTSIREWGRQTKVGGWEEETAHTGLLFGEAVADGWRVKAVIPDGPADRLAFGIRPGDVVTAIDGVRVGGDLDPTEVLNGPAGRTVRVTFRHGTNETKTVSIPSCDYAEARKKIGLEDVRAKRRLVHAKSGGRFGYLNIDAMNKKSLWLFQHEVFAEGYGRDGLVIDVRNNYGGSTADQMLQLLVGADHSRAVTRTCGAGYLAGYWKLPVWSKPIVVLCNEYTGSNGEIFSHAIKTLRRGKLVGRETEGAVIATNDAALLDLGEFRDARYGWFLPDGTDMEHHGARPDFEMDDSPSEVARGVDRQLEKAIEVLGDEVKHWREANPPTGFKYAR